MDLETRRRLKAQQAATVVVPTVTETTHPYPAVQVASVVIQPKKPKPPRTPAQHDRAMAQHGRLPHGARFEVVYDAEKRRWSGTLWDGSAVLYSGESGGVHRLLSELYQQWLAAQAGEQE